MTMTEAPSSTKQRLLLALTEAADERGVVRSTSDEIRHAVGLSRHDLLKYLWDLKGSGEITFREMGSGPTLHARGITIRGATTMTQTQRLRDYLQRQPADERGWKPYDSREVARALGISPNVTMVTMSNLIKEEGLSVKRGPGGKIEHVRFNGQAKPDEKKGEPVAEKRAEPVEEKSKAELPATPMLDEYRAARDVAASMAGNIYLAIEFTPNPMADEALTLIDWLRNERR